MWRHFWRFPCAATILVVPAQSHASDGFYLDAQLISLDLSVAPGRIASSNLASGEDVLPSASGCTVTLPVVLPLRGGKSGIIAGTPHRVKPDPVLVAALRKAHRMLTRDSAGLPTHTAAPTSPYDRRILRLALLAPDIQQAVLSGGHPRQLNLESLLNQDLPLAWPEQRRALGFSC